MTLAEFADLITEQVDGHRPTAVYTAEPGVVCSCGMTVPEHARHVADCVIAAMFNAGNRNHGG